MRRTRVALFALLFVSYAYFYQAGGWNQNSRFDLVRAITVNHSLQIDEFSRNTGDRAVANGHVYSDKAPGLALLGAPLVAMARPILVALGGDPESYGGIAFLSYLATVFIVSLATALAGAALFSFAVEFGASQAGALFAALAVGLATPIWPLATLFVGHALSGSCLLLAFIAATRIGTRGPESDVPLGLAVGVGAGWATVTEFPAGVPAVVLTMYTLALAWPLGMARLARIAGSLAAGALTCAAILGGYQYACFGSPFHVAYANEQGFEAMKKGWFGIAWPRAIRLHHLMTGQYRGLLPLAPIVAATPLGLAALARRGARATAAVLVAALIAAYYVVLNTGYMYWDGGWSYGPRHLMPAVPFLCVGLGALWTQAPRAGRAVLAALALYGAALSLMAVATMAQPPDIFQRPVQELIWPAFRDGDLALSQQTFVDAGMDVAGIRHAPPQTKAAWNLGMKVGLSGLASLIPLMLAWIACGVPISGGVARPMTRGPAPVPLRSSA